MAGRSRIPLPVLLVIQLLLTIVFVWLLNIIFEQYFYVEGGLSAFIIVGSLITLMNIIARPILHLLLLPFRLFFHLITIIIGNALFLALTERIASGFDPDLVVLHLAPGWGGWLLIAILLGLANWMMREILR